MAKAKGKMLITILVLLLAGIVFIVMGASNMSHTKNYKATEAVVTQIDSSPSTDIEEPDDETIYVKYTVDGKEYNEILQFAEGDCSEGETLSVMYDPDNPSYVTGASRKGSIIYMLLGAVFSIGALFSLIRFLVTGGR